MYQVFLAKTVRRSFKQVTSRINYIFGVKHYHPNNERRSVINKNKYQGSSKGPQLSGINVTTFSGQQRLQ